MAQDLDHAFRVETEQGPQEFVRRARPRYVFNSWRVTWYWRFAPRGPWSFRLGLTAKVRDAMIRLSGGGVRAEETDLGLVPLIHFGLTRTPGPRLALSIEGDALAAPQVRAEDVLVRIERRLDDRWSVYAGWRLLEGGADSDRVYTFGLFSHAVGGAIARL